jgi:putative membrane protein
MMKQTANKFLTESEQQQIRDAVKQAEAVTSGEIVPMVVSSSYSYPQAEIRGSLLLSSLAALLLTLLPDWGHIWIFLTLQVVGFVLFQELLRRVSWLKRPFLRQAEIDEEVEEGALKAFYQQGLYRTRDETGVLIYISLFEHKVWVLADKGINSQVEAGTWDAVVQTISKGLADKTPGPAICAGIEQCKKILAERFPVRGDDTNELHDLILGD